MFTIAATALRWGVPSLLGVVLATHVAPTISLSLGQNSANSRRTEPLTANTPNLPPSSEKAPLIHWVVNSPRSASSETIHRVCRVTAYCDRGLTAAGTLAGKGQCAAPEDIPFGTEVYIPALNKTFVVTDRTHKRFRQNTVDLFMPVKEECKKFGRNYLECEFRLPGQAWDRPRVAPHVTVIDFAGDNPRVAKR